MIAFEGESLWAIAAAKKTGRSPNPSKRLSNLFKA